MDLFDTKIERNNLDTKLKKSINIKPEVNTDSNEYLLNPENNRLTIYPIKNEDIWNSYKKQQAAFWTAEELDFSKDYDHFLKLTANEQHFIKMILAFFSSSDTIVNINLGERFLNDVKIREAITAYTFQMMIENVHAETYSLQIDNIIREPEEKNKLFNAVKEFPCIAEKASWAVKWIESDDSFAKRLIAFAIVEGIFFSGAFCSIFWLKKRNVMPGLCASNELIARDEGMHCISKGTLVSIGGFESLPIEELINNNNNKVLSYDNTKNNNGMIYSNQIKFKYQGEKKCIELIFEDGRKISCTPDHKILTKEGWKEAQNIILNKDKIIISPENPYFIRNSKDLDDEKKWKLNVGEKFIFSTDNIENTKKACAFARILGYLLTDGCLRKGQYSWLATLYMGHQIDVDSIQCDIKLAFNETLDKVIFDGCYRVCIKSNIAKSIASLENMPTGKRVILEDCTIPTFILSAPRIIIANFLAGLFGGDGVAPSSKISISKIQNKERFVLKNSVGFVFSKSNDMIGVKYQNELLELLNKFNIKGTFIQKQKIPINKDKITKYKYTIVINSEYITTFYRNIGFAHCVSKHTRLAVSASIINLRNNIKIQNEIITNNFNNLTNYSKLNDDAKKLEYSGSKKAHYINNNLKLKLDDYRDLAINDWKKNNPIFGYIKSSASIRDSIIDKTNNTVPFLDEKELLKSWGVYNWFRDETYQIKNKCKNNKSKNTTPTTYSTKRDKNTIPCMEMMVLHKRDVGDLDTYDITVENTSNFTANGVVVHNCDFAVLLYSMLENKLPESDIHAMFQDAVKIERKFICESLPCSLLGMNADMMNQYIQFVADRLLVVLGYSKFFNVSNPFDFMESISIEGKTNFFEHRPTQYQKAAVLNKSRDSTFKLTEDF
jgi:ribonucleotide reductase beta subunit family protein with ferritin-like domain